MAQKQLNLLKFQLQREDIKDTQCQRSDIVYQLNKQLFYRGKKSQSFSVRVTVQRKEVYKTTI